LRVGGIAVSGSSIAKMTFCVFRDLRQHSGTSMLSAVPAGRTGRRDRIAGSDKAVMTLRRLSRQVQTFRCGVAPRAFYFLIAASMLSRTPDMPSSGVGDRECA
jgi:hypothetical protein